MSDLVIIICTIAVVCLTVSMYISYKHDKVRLLSIDINELQVEEE